MRSMKMIACMLFVAFACGPVFGQGSPEFPRSLQEKIDAAKELCAATQDGEFALDDDAVIRIDLDGDKTSDWVLDEEKFACSTAVSLYCGTSGCMSHFLVGGKLQSLLNLGWSIVATPSGPVVLARLNSAACRGSVGSTCLSASLWDAESGKWRSAAAQW